MSVINTPLFSRLQLERGWGDRQQGEALLEDNSPPRFADRFFEDARDSHERVSVYLVNGFQLKGEVVSFDEEMILFKRIRTGRACGHVGNQLVKRSAVAVMYPLPKSKNQAEEWWRNYGACTNVEEAKPADPTPVTRGESEMILVVEDDNAELPFLPKPWTLTDLVTSVRDVLASTDPFDRLQTEERA